jgi:hypothetical protein
VRRFFQFRLRTLLAFMFLCSLAFGWVGANVREWQAEQRALAAIELASIDGLVYLHIDPTYVPISPPPAPSGLIPVPYAV